MSNDSSYLELVQIIEAYVQNIRKHISLVL